MKAHIFRRDSVNSITTILSGRAFRIVSADEIKLAVERSVRRTIAEAATIEDLRADLRHFNLTLE